MPKASNPGYTHNQPLRSPRRRHIKHPRRLLLILARSAEEKPASNDLGLFEAMVAGLEGMTTSAWPDRVFELGGALEEVPVS